MAKFQQDIPNRVTVYHDDIEQEKQYRQPPHSVDHQSMT